MNTATINNEVNNEVNNEAVAVDAKEQRVKDGLIPTKTSASFTQELHDMNAQGIKFPYAAKLKEEFGVEVPASAPLYQIEYLYKYCRNGAVTKCVPADKLVAYATKKADELFAAFPWIKTKYDTVVAVKEKTHRARKDVDPATKRLPEHADYADGTVLQCPVRGLHMLYLGGKIAVRAKTVDKMKEIALKKLNYTVA